MKLKKTAFTLIEITAGIVILSVMAVMAVNGYKKVLERQYYREAYRTAVIAHSAAQTYYIKYNTFKTVPYYGYSAADLNSALGINVIGSDKLTYFFYGNATRFSVNVRRNMAYTENDYFALSTVATSTSVISDTHPACSGKACP